MIGHTRLPAQLASRYAVIATEDLSLIVLTRHSGAHEKGLNRSFADVAPGMIDQFLSYKMAEAGGEYGNNLAPRRYKPSRTCPRCLAVCKKTLAQRMHRCLACGYVVDRDVAAGPICQMVYEQHYPGPAKLQGWYGPGVEDGQRSGQPGSHPVLTINSDGQQEARNRHLAA